MSKVLFVVGSKHDIPLLAEAKKVLQKENILFETTVVSAHRNIQELVIRLLPQKLIDRNIGVIIAVAHSVANLPAILAGYLKDTPIPVLGVGVTKSDIDSLASLLSVISIPRGIPLMNVGINDVGMHNAALCAVKLLRR